MNLSEPPIFFESQPNQVFNIFLHSKLLESNEYRYGVRVEPQLLRKQEVRLKHQLGLELSRTFTDELLLQLNSSSGQSQVPDGELESLLLVSIPLDWEGSVIMRARSFRFYLSIPAMRPSDLTYSTTDNLSAVDALQLLKDGNTRYMEDRLEHPHEGKQHRVELSVAQHPFAIILGCADSRVIPELIFDRGMGDLFVIRLAGNIADDAVIASIEYAIEHLGTQLVVVLGHENCGAVKAAVNHETSAGKINSLMYYIEPALNCVVSSSENLLEKVIKTHVRHMVDLISCAEPILSIKCQMGNLTVLPAYYSLSTGKVDFENSLI